MPPVTERQGLLLDIGGVVHRTGLMTDAKAAGVRVGALTNDMTAFHAGGHRGIS